jgi:hypothetical protein
VFRQISFDELRIHGETVKEKQIVCWDIRQTLFASLLKVGLAIVSAGQY